MKRIITFLLGALLALLSFTAFGCTSRAPGGFHINSGNSAGGGQYGMPFKATLKAGDGIALEGVENITAIWTAKEGGDVHTAPFNEEGVAIVYGPDGEYNLTLSALPQGYTYDPNLYVADNLTPELTVVLYPLRQFTGGNGSGPENGRRSIMNTTGAYRFIFEEVTDVYYFSIEMSFSSKMNLRSMMNVTADNASPVLYQIHGTPGIYWGTETLYTGGGAEGVFTKNFRFEYGLTDSQGLQFRLGIQVLEEGVLPVTVDVLLASDGEYNEGSTSLPMVPVPEDLQPNGGQEEPTGTFVLLGDLNGRMLDESMVKKGEDGFYYYTRNNKQYLLYAVLTKDVSGMITTETGQGLNDPKVRHTCYRCGEKKDEKKDYTNFFKAHAALVNGKGSYPVTDGLKAYLQDYSVSKQVFFDGYGSAEGDSGYRSDGDSRWMFVCGVYM